MATASPGGRVNSGSLSAPLRLRLFRALWLANLVSNLGWLIQATAAAWLMTSLAGTADKVALVQASVQAPIVLVSLLAGAAADVWDRRLVLLIAQGWMLTVSVLLAMLTAAGLVAPWSLLAFTFALGLGAALQGPAFQAVVRELVPGDQLSAAVTLNGIAFNLARSVGPAIGGAIIAFAGPEAAFVVNAVTYTGMILVLITWRRPTTADDLPREHVASAVVTGLRYVAETPAIRNVMVRSAAFGFAGGAPMALLPLVARDLLGGGPVTYGILVAGFGAGAMAGAFAVQPARQRLGAERLVRWMAVAFSAQLAILALVPSTAAMIVGLALGGVAWLGSFTTFNIAVQTSAAFWVQARTFAIYQTAMFASMALGSWIWGELADGFGLRTSLLIAAACAAVTIPLGLAFRLPTGPAPDLRPLPRRPDPVAAFPFDQDEGPVLVLVEYRVSTQDARAFARVIEEVGHLRKRNGATRWQAFQDVADAEHWVEAFTVGSWLDYRRQARRLTAADAAIEGRAIHYHKGTEPPVTRHMIARQFADPGNA